MRRQHSGNSDSWTRHCQPAPGGYWIKIGCWVQTRLIRAGADAGLAAKNPPRLPPAAWPRPERPWCRVHIDYAGPINGVTYLILIDVFSKWPEVVPVIPPTTTNTIRALSQLFSQHSLPETLESDNGSQFCSSCFQEFCRENAITHFRSPPYHPQSNGQAERFVDTFKRALLKSRGEGTPVEVLQGFLLVYRTTPNESLEDRKSPAEALKGRKLPTTNWAMSPAPTASSRPDVNKKNRPSSK
ncbi:hypothetical protein T265_09181 [Opisthorchis viverrini]|uniref:Integrase catalytic domain-containing protein n=1 Tax=Opisthorchis viverrini TaxID=6198 RepID=A0A074ZB69_OPIVI|nr:hypothetical protein T265_09181 [Opisthorchis viverrini]KER22812.1 hypothetical protein T265_09181 [Opisthorchis viverrini]